jgi:predicted RND superfamily exporter protein
MHLHNPPLIARLVQRVTDARWRVLIVAVFLVAAIGTGVARLTMNADYKVFFSKENPQLSAFDALQNTYTKDDNILIALEPANGNVFSRETLAALESLVAQSWRVPFATRVDAITNFQVTRADGDDLYVEDLVRHAATLSDADLAAVRTTALAEPQLVRRLVSPRGDITALNITLKLPGERIGEEFDAIEAVRANLAEFRQRHPDIEVHTSGVAMLFAGFSEAMQRDMGTLVPLTFLAALIVIGAATRSPSGTASALVVVLLAIVTAMGAAGYLGIQFTAPIASVPTMIMTLGVADSVHVLSAAQRAMVRGLSKREALRESLRLNAMPVMLTSVTTAIGFLSMNFSEVPPFRDLGNMTAIGILAAGILSLTVLPALLLLLPFRPARRTKEEAARRAALLARLGEVVAARHRLVLAGGGALALAAAVLATRNELSDEMVKYLDPRIEFRRDTDYLSKRLTGIYTIEYSVGAGRSGGIADPAYLRLLHDFRRWLEAQPNVKHVSAFDEVAKRINRAMHGDSAAYYRLPENADEAAQYLLLYEMSLPYGLDLNNQINVDKSATRVVATVDNLPSERLIALTEAGEAWLRQHGPTAAATHGTSMPLIFAHLVRRQIRSMLTGTVWSVVLIAGLLALVLRSVRYGAISVVAISVPIVAAFGVWAVVKGQITGGLAIVTGMTLGIIDDDVVHFISKYRVAVEEHGLPARAAVRHALSAVGWDLIVTSVALIAGFLVLAQSSFGLFFDLAKLTAITIGIALLFNLVFLPALLVWLEERRTPAAVVTATLPAGRRAAAIVFLVCGLGIGGVFGPARVQAQQSRHPAPDASAGGLAVAREADRRDSGWRSSVVEVRMTLMNAHGQTSERRMRSAMLEVTGDGDRTLVVFDEPADVKGSAVLTYSHASAADDQWLYLPAVRRVKRIASSNKAGPFMGSEFAFEDLASQEIEKYTYRLVGEDTLGGLPAFVVERDPVDPQSGYTRQRVWYDQSHYRPLKIDYFDRKDAPLKTLTYERYQAYGAFWRARAQLMVNHQTGKRTRVEFDEYRLDAGLTPADFEVARLGGVR